MTKKESSTYEPVFSTGSVTTVSAEDRSAAKQKLARLMKEEMKLVKGIFKNFECPGASQRIQVRKYKEHFFDKVMQDGFEYEVPLYIARHLNGIDATAEHVNGKIHSCCYPIHGFMASDDAHLAESQEGAGGVPVPVAKPVQWKARFGFQSTEFGSAA